MPDYSCPKLGFELGNLECPVYCGIKGTGSLCLEEDNSPCGEYYKPRVDLLKIEEKIEERILEDY